MRDCKRLVDDIHEAVPCLLLPLPIQIIYFKILSLDSVGDKLYMILLINKAATHIYPTNSRSIWIMCRTGAPKVVYELPSFPDMHRLKV